MRGLRPDNETDLNNEVQELEKLQITPPPKTQTETQPAQIQRSPASTAEARFEKILQHELSGTSFSFGVERKPNIEVAHSSTKQKPKLTKLSKAKTLKTSPFEGETILDKIVSFVAYLLKALERFFFRAKMLPRAQGPQKQIVTDNKSRPTPKKKRWKLF